MMCVVAAGFGSTLCVMLLSLALHWSAGHRERSQTNVECLGGEPVKHACVLSTYHQLAMH